MEKPVATDAALVLDRVLESAKLVKEKKSKCSCRLTKKISVTVIIDILKQVNKRCC